MSSRKWKGKGRAESSVWGPWSEWSNSTWDENRGLFYYYRSRTNQRTGELDYETNYPEASEPVASVPPIRDIGVQYGKAQPSYSLGSKENGKFSIVTIWQLLR
jgi:hypothetical protein